MASSHCTGKVKLAQHSETGQRVAIKIIGKATIRQQNELSRDTDRASKKMEREIAVMKIVHHPHVLSLYDVYESAADLFLVMELVEGGELFDYISSNGRLDEAESLRLFQQIIHGVHHCHKNLIIHRDLKPENVLLDANRNVKIAGIPK